jgi:hypothetical protein
MQAAGREKIRWVWKQGKIPVVANKGKGHRLRVRLPYSDDNYRWLRQFGRIRPKWNLEKKCWEVPRSWLDELVKTALADFNHVYLVQPYSSQEKCARQCWEAQGYDCECSCMGEHHGSQDSGRRWREVSETFAVRTSEETIACRLLSK